MRHTARFGWHRANLATWSIVAILGCMAPIGAQEPVKKPASRLLVEPSPYLRQHAADPVDWYPWGEEAFARAAREDKLVFLSIGYAACHWCHVMQRESFQNQKIADILNQGFVSIKLDREERPDVDRVYIEACQRLGSGNCGWPLTAFLLPTREPIFVGTYFPPEDVEGRPGFASICQRLEKVWKEDREGLLRRGATVKDYLRTAQKLSSTSELPGRDLIERARDSLLAAEDPVHGGFGPAPKFPRPSALLLLARQAERAGDEAAAGALRRTLDALLRGGIRDQLDEGFHRYSVDVEWRVPHFEKMLYDQALLAQTLAISGHALREPRYTEAARSVLAWCARTLRADGGGYIAALDADVEHEEGLTYLWSYPELEAALTAQELRVFAPAHGVTREGQLEGKNVLIAAASVESIARSSGMTPTAVSESLASARAKLQRLRASRPQPRRDTKVIVSSNAYLVSAWAALARSGADPQAESEMLALWQFVSEKLIDPKSGAVLRLWTGTEARHHGDLLDHAAVLVAALDVASTTFDRRVLVLAEKVAARMRDHFIVGESRLVDAVAADLLVETAETFDGATPAGRSLALVGWTRLGIALGEQAWLDLAANHLRDAGTIYLQAPDASPHVLLALDLLLGPSPRAELHAADVSSGEAATLAHHLRLHAPSYLELVGPSPEPSAAPLVSICVGNTCLAPAKTADEIDARIAESLRR